MWVLFPISSGALNDDVALIDTTNKDSARNVREWPVDISSNADKVPKNSALYDWRYFTCIYMYLPS